MGGVKKHRLVGSLREQEETALKQWRQGHRQPGPSWGGLGGFWGLDLLLFGGFGAIADAGSIAARARSGTHELQTSTAGAGHGFATGLLATTTFSFSGHVDEVKFLMKIVNFVKKLG